QGLPAIDVKGQKSREKNSNDFAGDEPARVTVEQPGEGRLRVADNARQERQNGDDKQAAAKDCQREKWIPGTRFVGHSYFPNRQIRTVRSSLPLASSLPSAEMFTHQPPRLNSLAGFPVATSYN